MTTNLLFCIADEARDFARTIADIELPGGGPKIFQLVESRNLVIDKKEAQFVDPSEASSIAKNNEFNGASIEECQKWALEKAWKCNNIIRDTIGVIDARSGEDGTVLMRVYHEDYEAPEGQQAGFFFGHYGMLPPEWNTWYGWRIKPENDNIWNFCCALGEEGEYSSVYPVYYGSKDKFTDENGVFDVAEAERFCRMQDEDVKQSEVHKWREEVPSMARDLDGNPL